MKLTLPVLLTLTTTLPAACASATTGDDLQMIAPDGFRYTSRQQYVDFHRQWFAAHDNGRRDCEIIHLAQSPALAHALIRHRYRSTGPDGNAHDIVSWLTLTFALESGRWRLVFDQNTLIQPQGPAAGK